MALGANVHFLYQQLRNHLTCSNPPAAGSELCRSSTFHTATRYGVTAVSGLLLLYVIYVMTLWALRPLHILAETVDRLGPQNMNDRASVPTLRRDEYTRLATAINASLERIAVGYEGQRRFAANASHELRTPLAVQRALIEVGMSTPPTAEQLDLLTRQLLDTNQRNVDLIEGLLVLSESDRGLASVSAQPLADVTAAIVEAHQDLARSAEVTLDVTLHERTVPGEKVLLERLVTNLVQNAIRYNRPGGRVTVEVTDEPALRVANTGQHVPAEALGALFEPFRRLDRDRIHHSDGAGLGLTIARSITTAHQGTITARANPEGGLTIDVYLPAAHPA